jgi:acyl carrier protein
MVEAAFGRWKGRGAVTTQDRHDDTWTQIAALIVKMAPLQVQEWSADTHLINELGYDSIAAVELIFEVERTFDTDPLPDELGFTVETVGELAGLLRDELERR